MLLNLYLGLLALTATAVVILMLGRDAGERSRTLGDVLIAATPILGLGVLGCLVLSANGTPMMEWLAPTAGLLLVGISRRSDRTFLAAAWGFLLASVVLVGMFFTLTSRDYTIHPGLDAALTRTSTVRAGKALRDRFPADAVVPSGPVAQAVDDPSFDTLPVRRTEPLWHTPVTRLHRVHRETAVAWTPGGAPKAAAKGVELRR